MSDLELTKLCAEAMGWKHLGAIGVPPPKRGESDPKGLWCLSGGNDWWLNPEGHRVCGQCSSIPDPLHDDAQAMALEDWLIERGYLHYEDGDHLFYSWPLETSAFTFSADFDSKAGRRRAIVECVAKMQAIKPTDAGNERGKGC